VARIDPKTNRVTKRIPVDVSPCGIGIGAGAVWVDGYGTGYVERIDPRRLKVTGRVRVALGNTLWDVTFGAGSVWGTDYTGGVVIRIDPRTLRVSSSGSRSTASRPTSATAQARSGSATRAERRCSASIPPPTQ
jgi:streptogramin lyase